MALALDMELLTLIAATVAILLNSLLAWLALRQLHANTAVTDTVKRTTDQIHANTSRLLQALEGLTLVNKRIDVLEDVVRTLDGRNKEA